METDRGHPAPPAPPPPAVHFDPVGECVAFRRTAKCNHDGAREPWLDLSCVGISYAVLTVNLGYRLRDTHTHRETHDTDTHRDMTLCTHFFSQLVVVRSLTDTVPQHVSGFCECTDSRHAARVGCDGHQTAVSGVC